MQQLCVSPGKIETTKSIIGVIHGIADTLPSAGRMHKLQDLLILAVVQLQMKVTLTDDSLNCTSPAEKCPLTYEDWQKRAREYNCTTRQYTCIMDMNKDFVEACTWEYKMRTGKLRTSLKFFI